MNGIEVELGDLFEHPDNPRLGDVDAIAASLQTNGQFKPIVVNSRNNRVLAGNHTLKAAKSIGWKTIVAVFVDVDEDNEKRILLIDNKLNDDAEYDREMLGQLLKDLSVDEGDLLSTGFTGTELEENVSADSNASTATPSLVERANTYADRQVRSLVLDYELQIYKDVMRMSMEIRGRRKIDTMSDLFKILIEEV